MPTVSEQFTSYREFASASLEEIYGNRLDRALELKANHLESGVWLNTTKGRGALSFRWISLPWETQLSPVNAIASGDFDRNGKIELAIAQNHYSNQVETGLWRGNPGCHVEWELDQFQLIRPPVSGLFLPDDTKSILSLDSDGNGWQDILAGQNNDAVLLFRNLGR